MRATMAGLLASSRLDSQIRGKGDRTTVRILCQGLKPSFQRVLKAILDTPNCSCKSARRALGYVNRHHLN